MLSDKEEKSSSILKELEKASTIEKNTIDGEDDHAGEWN
jgi:hypothetical protein